MHLRRTLATLSLAALAALAAGCARRSTLLEPDAKALTRQAPDTFNVRFETTRGPFTV